MRYYMLAMFAFWCGWAVRGALWRDRLYRISEITQFPDPTRVRIVRVPKNPEPPRAA